MPFDTVLDPEAPRRGRRIDPRTGLPATDPPLPDAPPGPAPAGVAPPLPDTPSLTAGAGGVGVPVPAGPVRVSAQVSPPDATRGEAGAPTGGVDPAEQAMMRMIRAAPDVGSAPRGASPLSVPPVNPEQMGANLQKFIQAAGGPWPDRQRP